jgi:hypothetical protein
MTENEEDRERTSMDVDEGTPEDPLLRREEAAAAREAGGIGGRAPEYEDEEDLQASEAERPLAEAGEGEAEGLEQAELDLERAAEPTAPGMSPSQHAIEDAIEESANPLAGEQLEEQPTEPTGWKPPTSDRPATADEPAPFDAKKDDDKKSDDDDDKEKESEPIDWSTWSGRSVEP